MNVSSPANSAEPGGRPTHLDLFSGIGGFALAAEAAGYQTIGFSEIEPYACKVLKRHWPSVPNFGDIRNVRGIRCDLITGGFPCQPFSVAGKRGGAGDDRALWPEMFRVIDEARPAWVLGENVPGIISMELDRVLSDLESIGYAAWPLGIPACAVDARHRRERIWIVAHANARMRGQGRNGREHSAGKRSLHEPSGSSESAQLMADTKKGNGRLQLPTGNQKKSDEPTGGGETLSDDGSRRGERERRAVGGEQKPARWEPEPGICRVANGIPNRSHRLRGLGNAIVPQVAEVLMREMAKTFTNQPEQ